MFGNHDKQDQQDDTVQPTTDTNDLAAAHAAAVPDPTPTATLDESAPSDTLDLPSSMGVSTTPPTNWSQGDESAAPEPATSAPATAAPAAPAPGVDDLVNLKQSALQQLAPLVDHLDQTPEEKFRTTMMMIQATDDSSKIKDAYEAAQQITDEKVRAQALLDVVNEINYFTHQQGAEQPTVEA